jgi:hypothetical protein
VVEDGRRARDLGLLDAVDAFARETVELAVWRLVRTGRDPAQGGPSRSRWCNGTFDVLYTSLDRDGAIAEIYALLSLQPVFPSKVDWSAYKLTVSATNALRLADLETLAKLGVDVARYKELNYDRTQEIADAAFFLGFDGLIAPSARWPCQNFILFTDRIPLDQIEVVGAPETPIDWNSWRKQVRR